MKAPQLADGTGVNLMSMVKFLQLAVVDLEAEEQEEAAHYLEMIREFLIKDVANGKEFRYSSKVLGL